MNATMGPRCNFKIDLKFECLAMARSASDGRRFDPGESMYNATQFIHSSIESQSTHYNELNRSMQFAYSAHPIRTDLDVIDQAKQPF